MDLRDYLRVLRKRWRLVALCTLLAIAGAAGATLVATPTYTASAQLFISARGADNISGAYQGGIFTQQRVKSYADIVDSPQVTQPVIDKLRLDKTADELAGQITATNPIDTVLLEISVDDQDPQLAGNIANALAAQFTETIKTLETPDGGTDALVKATVVKAADVPTSPTSPRPKVNLALGLLIGLAAGVGAAVLRETLDTTVKSTADVKEHTNGPVMGVVPDDPQTAKSPLVTESALAQNVRLESYRQVRTNLQFVDVDRPVRTLVVTSALPSEGKSTTACNLAIALAEAGRRVVVIEADLRRPRTADYFGLEGGVGVTNVLLGQAGATDLVQQWGRIPLWVLPSGPIPPNPSEMLGSHQMGELLKELMSTYDVVLLDAPPLLPVTDAAVLAAQCDGALLVARYGHTTRDQLALAAGAISQVGATLFGTILNRVPIESGSHGYGYGYGYSYGYESDGTRPRLVRADGASGTTVTPRARGPRHR